MKNDPITATPWQTLYESDDINRDLLQLFDNQKVSRLVTLMGNKARPWAVKRGLQITVRHFLSARLLASPKAPGKAEWKRMIRFRDTANAFVQALEGLRDFGNAEQRLILDMASPPPNEVGPGEQRFKKMLEKEGPGSPLRNLRLFAKATAKSAERLTTQSLPAEGSSPASDYLSNIAWLATPDDKRNADAFCLKEGLHAFRRVWEMNSTKPFNSGKYYSDIGAFVGDAISATHLVMNTLDPQITQRRIATSIREMNASKSGDRK